MRSHISQAGIPILFIIGNLGALAGGLIMASVFDRVGHRHTVGATYLLSAAAVAVLAVATASGSAVWVTLAFVVANGVGTAAWTSGLSDVHRAVPDAPARCRGRRVGGGGSDRGASAIRIVVCSGRQVARSRRAPMLAQ